MHSSLLDTGVAIALLTGCATIFIIDLRRLLTRGR